MTSRWAAAPIGSSACSTAEASGETGWRSAMYARVTQLEIDTMRVSVTAAVARFEAEVLPDLRDQEGYCGVYVLVTPDGQATLVSFWDTEEQADASGSTGFSPETPTPSATLLAAP